MTRSEVSLYQLHKTLFFLEDFTDRGKFHTMRMLNRRWGKRRWCAFEAFWMVFFSTLHTSLASKGAERIGVMKNYVLSRAMAPLMMVAEKRGLDEGELVDGLSFDHEISRGSPHRKLPWEEFVLYLERLHNAVGEDLYEDVKEVVREPGHFAMFYRIGGVFCSPQTYFRIANRFFAPMVFPVMEVEVLDDEKEGCRMVSSLPAEATDCDVFWETSRALMEVGPVALGMRPARVQMKRALRKAEYEVKFPPSRGLLTRARRFVDLVVSGDLFMKELEQQNENLMESYEALQRSERSFRRLVEESPEGMAVYDTRSIVFANDSLAKLIGLERGEDLKGRAVDSLTRDPVELAGKFGAGEGAVKMVTLNHSCRGSVQAEVSTFETTFKGRRVCISMFRDITVRNELMARAVDMDRLITMGTLAAGVAHEINNPVAIVQANVEFVAEFFDDFLQNQPECIDSTDAFEITDALASSVRALERTQEITGELTTIGRGPSEQLEVIDPRLVIDGSMQWVRSLLRARARIITDLAPCGLVHSNAPRIGQVVLNALLNASHAIEPGDPDGNQVRIATYCDDHRAYIEILDTGHGIAPEHLDRVFEPFFTTKPEGVGTGLGLFVSHSIMERLGGKLTIESTVGEGTKVIVGLPLHRS